MLSDLLDRLINDTYGLEYQDYIDTKFYSKLVSKKVIIMKTIMN